MFKKLLSSWFSFARSSKAMMRGKVNENAVLKVLLSKVFILGLYNCGVMAEKDNPSILCSTDGMVIIYIQKTAFLTSSLRKTLPRSYFMKLSQLILHRLYDSPYWMGTFIFCAHSYEMKFLSCLFVESILDSFCSKSLLPELNNVSTLSAPRQHCCPAF